MTGLIPHNPFLSIDIRLIRVVPVAVKRRAGGGAEGKWGPRFAAVLSAESQSGPGTAGCRQAVRRIESGHEGLHHPGDFVDGLVLANDPFTQASFEVYGVWATQGGVQLHPLDSTHGVPLLLTDLGTFPGCGACPVGALLARQRQHLHGRCYEICGRMIGWP